MSARAADADANMQLATQFFDTAVQRMADGKCESSPVGDADVCREARDLLQRACALYPSGLGALRNLARVERGLGLYASAARHLRELVRRAPSDPKPSRQLWAAFARRELQEIDASIPYVVLRLDEGSVSDLSLSIDGTKIPVEVLGARFDVDPGDHTIQATAQGQLAFEAKVHVRDGETKTVVLAFEPQPANPKRDRAEPATAPEAPAGPPRRPVVPLLLAGAGVIGVAVGLGLGAVAIEKRNTACGESMFCEPNDFETGKSFARASTIVTSAGAAVFVAGGLWYLLSASKSPPHARASSLSITISPTVASSLLGLQTTARFP